MAQVTSDKKYKLQQLCWSFFYSIHNNLDISFCKLLSFLYEALLSSRSPLQTE